MTTLLTCARNGWRQVLATPGRSLVIVLAMATPIALATLVGIDGDAGSIGVVCGSLAAALAVLLVAQASAEPVRISSTRAWSAAGARPWVAHLPARFAGLILSWLALGAGVVGGTTLAALSGLDVHWMSIGAATAVACLAFVAVVAVTGPTDLHRARRVFSTVRAAIWWVVVIPLAIAGSLASAVSMRTDFDAQLGIPILLVLATVIVTSLLRPAAWAAVRLLGLRRAWRPTQTAAGGYHTSRLVRAVISSSMLVALTGLVLGSSVAERGDPYAQISAQIAALPVVPTNVAVLDPQQPQSGAAAGRSSRAVLDLVGALSAGLPAANVIASTEVVPASAEQAAQWGCLQVATTSCGLRLLVDDPRVADVPTLTNTAAAPRGLFEAAGVDRLLSRWEQGEQLPPATWRGLDLILVPASELTPQTAHTIPGPVFVTRSTPFTAAERNQIEAVAEKVGAKFAAPFSVTTSDQRTGPVGRQLGEVPWAPTGSGTRWLWLGLASALALLTALSTVTISAHDRRGANRRLEVVGATPGEVRAALAVHTGLLLGLAALLAGVTVIGLAHLGLNAFATAKPRLAIPLTVPVLPLVVLLFAVPIISAGCAALVARGLSRRSPIHASRPWRPTRSVVPGRP